MTGHNTLKMDDLSELYIALGFKDAETYIQSGNVIFSEAGDDSVSELSNKIEKGINDKFSLNVPVMLRSLEEIERVVCH